MVIKRIALAAFCGLLIHATGAAAYVATNDDFPAPSYGQPPGSFINIVGTPYSIRDLVLTPVGSRRSLSLGNFAWDSLFDIFMDLSIDSGLSWNPFGFSAPGWIDIPGASFDPMYPDTLDYSNMLFNLEPAGPSIPEISLRASPTLPSLGQTSVTDLGSGYYRIDSFFDIYFELSDDFGNTWKQADAPMHVSGIPEPETYAMLLAGLGLVGFMARRRRPVCSNKGFGICFMPCESDVLRTRATHGPFAIANLRRWT